MSKKYRILIEIEEEDENGIYYTHHIEELTDTFNTIEKAQKTVEKLKEATK